MSEDQELDDREARIRELEATVQTLTADLLDATERIRALEAEIGTQTTDADEERAPDRWVPAAEREDGAESTDDADDGTTRDTDGIIVA